MVAISRTLVRVTLVLMCIGASALSANERSVSYQNMAYAPNAGGQVAHSLKLARGNQEYSVFANEYLRAGDYPLMGATWEWRQGICAKDCWGNLYLQGGIGASFGGPLLTMTWSAQFPPLPLWLPFAAPNYLPQLRLDFSQHFILVQYRAISWSYPLWLGITLPF